MSKKSVAKPKIRHYRQVYTVLHPQTIRRMRPLAQAHGSFGASTCVLWRKHTRHLAQAHASSGATKAAVLWRIQGRTSSSRRCVPFYCLVFIACSRRSFSTLSHIETTNTLPFFSYTFETRSHITVVLASSSACTSVLWRGTFLARVLWRPRPLAPDGPKYDVFLPRGTQ